MEKYGRISFMLKHYVSLIVGISWISVIALQAEMPKLPEGFKFETLYKVPKKEQGSWVSITKDDQGRFIVSDQYGSLFRVTVAEGGKVLVQKIPVKMGGAQGLLWFKGKLYASVAAKSIVPEGLYVVSDSNEDGELDRVELLQKLNGGGEHGPHSLVASPDGDWIYHACGNHTNIPGKIDHFHNTKKWSEDQLIPSQPDARGHARSRRAPGGWITRFKPDGSRWELFSQGYRNQYDMAFNVDGELFTYDSDMEWDFGTPWYRPTRICHVTSGSEFGWRTGTAKWPVSYLDSVPGILDIGPGSPTGVVAGLEAKFPTRYRASLFALDWTFATIYAIQVKRSGAGYTAKKEEFMASTGMPLADAVIGNDGAMYILTGGRRTDSALHRISYVGKESTAAPVAAKSNPLLEIRKKLDALHVNPDEEQLDFILQNLSHDDRMIRYSARVALEHLPVALWGEKVFNLTNTGALLQASVAIAHQADAATGERMLGKLSAMDFGQLSLDNQIGLLRAQGLIFVRHGKQRDAMRKAVIDQLDAHYPAQDDRVNRELCRMLSYLQAPSVVEKTLKLVASPSQPKIPAWLELASRNARYGNPIIEMIMNMPSTQNLHYVYCLRVVKGPWKEEHRREYFEWFLQASRKSGGRSYKGFLNNIRKEALSNATSDEQKMIAGWKLVDKADPFKNLPQPKGPGKNWKVDQVAKLDVSKADLKNGERMYRASLCAACHQVNGQGGGAGPDLTNAAGRFKLKDFAEAIIDPSKVVSDQYEFKIIKKKDGSLVIGKVLSEKDGFLTVGTSAYDFGVTVQVKMDDVESIKASPVSPMPAALINRLNKQELTDLMGYLMSLK